MSYGEFMNLEHLGTTVVEHWPQQTYRFSARRHPDGSLDSYVCDVLDSESKEELARWERAGEWDGDLMKELPRWKPLGSGYGRQLPNGAMEAMFQLALREKLAGVILGEG